MPEKVAFNYTRNS